MNYLTAALVLASVLMSAIAQLLLKTGMSRPDVVAAINEGRPVSTAVALMTTIEVIGGLGLYGLGAVMWLFVLAKLDLSAAYPFVGLGFIATMLLSILVLGEDVSTGRIVGTLLIVAGCALVARSL